MTTNGPSGIRRARYGGSVAAATLLAGLLSGGSQASESADGPMRISYDCGLASDVAVEAEITAAYPGEAAVGEPIEPVEEVTLTVTVPSDALAALVPAGTTAVTSTAALTVEVTQNEQSAQARWSRLAAPETALTTQGTSRLAHTGPVPTVTVGAPGEVKLTASTITLDITPLGGAADTPRTLTCEPAPGAEAAFATVQIPDAAGSPTGGRPSPGDSDSAQPGQQDRSGIAVDPGARAAGPALTCPTEQPQGEPVLDDVPMPPPGGTVREGHANLRVCAYSAGISNVLKQNGAVVINDPRAEPALINFWGNKNTFSRGNPFYNRNDSVGEIQVPDTEATLLAFGFMPVSAKISFETGQVSASTGTIGRSADRRDFAVVQFMQSLRIHDVSVNGTPLDVGPDCRTEVPFRVLLTGRVKKGGIGTYKNVLEGGLLNGKVTVPPFTGCGTGGEDLDALFTAAISGPNNDLVLNQAMVCLPDSENKDGCPPAVPPLPAHIPTDD